MEATGPIPGRTPTSVPIKAPTKPCRRLTGCKAIEKPYNKLLSVSTNDLSMKEAGYVIYLAKIGWSAKPQKGGRKR
jgi:hypothetical protein